MKRSISLYESRTQMLIIYDLYFNVSQKILNNLHIISLLILIIQKLTHIVKMKYNGYLKDYSKRYHKNSKQKVNLNLTYQSFSKSKNKNLRTSADQSPHKYLDQSKQKPSFTKDKFKQSIQRIATENNQFLNPSKRKSYTNKTPKTSNTWLVRQQPKQESGNRSKSKIDDKKHIYIPRLESSMSPKTFENAFTFAEQSYHSSKAKDNTRYKSFNKHGDLRNLLEQKNKGFIKQSLKIKTQYEVKSISPIHRKTHRQQQQKQKNKRPPSYDQTQSAKAKTQKSKVTDDSKQQKQQKQNFNQNTYNCQFQLTEEQFKNFGDRFPQNFIKVALLGRGGFSLVWLGIQRKTKKKLAIKQILTKNPHQTHLKEIWFGSYYFNPGGEPREQFSNHPGINNICRLLAYDIKPQDTWLFYQLCQQSLGNSLYQLKGQTINQERQYKIVYKPFYQKLRQNPQQIKSLIIQLSKALMLMSSHNIVHSDLKTQNILLKFKKKQEILQSPTQSCIKCVKIIDFGSSFLFTNLKQFSMATPQYMPPQILNYILFQNQLQYDQELLLKIQKYKNPWVVDIWSLGCIILQIICGVPLWMSLKTKIQYKGQNTYAAGLFAVKGRLFPKIIAKQIQAIKRLDYHLDHDNNSGIKITKQVRIILKKMLSLEPEQRISPRDILNHFNIQCEPDRVPFY